MIEKHLHELLLLRNLESSQKKEHDWHEAYDQCIWDIIVSTEQELVNVFKESWSFDLPVPIHTLICQRLALISQDSTIKKEAILLAKIYCNPNEEKNVTLGVN